MTGASEPPARRPGAHGELRRRLADLEALEPQIPALAGSGSAEASFRHVGGWLVREEALRERLRLPLPARMGGALAEAPGLPVRGAASALWQLARAPRLRVRTAARAIRLRSNLRAFYGGSPALTLWIAGPPQPTLRLQAALEIRSRFPVDAVLRPPRLVAYDLDDAPAYLLEERVRGRPFGRRRDWRLLAGRGLPELFRFYDLGGIRQRRAAELFDATRIRAALRRLSSPSAGNRAWALPARLREAAERSLELADETLPLCRGHGDLTKSNLLIDRDGGIAVLDWERARELPLARELLKLVRQRPGLLERIAPDLARRTEDPRHASPQRQLLLATLARIAELVGSGAEAPSAHLDPRRARKIGRWMPLVSLLTREGKRADVGSRRPEASAAGARPRCGSEPRDARQSRPRGP